MEVELYERLRELPLYDEDLDTEDPPEPAADLRARIAAADGLLIVTPEYNYSLPGGLKTRSTGPRACRAAHRSSRAGPRRSPGPGRRRPWWGRERARAGRTCQRRTDLVRLASELR
jgi:hypothetical protein